MKINILMLTTLFAFFALNPSAIALDVSITQDMSFVTIEHEGKSIRIERVQDQSNHIAGDFSKTSRKCPPFCIQPMIVAPGVTTLGELEVIQFITDYLKTDKGVLVDARTPSWHSKGTIPGSTNIPFTVFALNHDNKNLIAAMKKFSVVHRVKPASGYWADLKVLVGLEKKSNPYWDYSSAKNLLLWCNGMWCGQSPRAIHGLLKHGYPAEKLHYYRDGMQGWQILGLTVTIPE